jgi:hypothetical protein
MGALTREEDVVTEMIRGVRDSMPSSEEILHALGLQYERSTQAAVATTLTAFAVGAIAGAVMATLFAPKPGAEMRQELNERVRAWGDKMRFAGRQDEDEQASKH